jgi:hypothetical protein
MTWASGSMTPDEPVSDGVTGARGDGNGIGQVRLDRGIHVGE